MIPRTPSGRWIVPANGEQPSEDEPRVERRDGGVHIPKQLLWPLVALVLGGSGSGVAAALGLVPQASTPAADERAAVVAAKVSQLEEAVREHRAEHAAMRAEQEKQGRLLVRIAERLRVRDQ